MAKRTPKPCTPANCGDLYPKCGKRSTYTHGKCRCDSCHAATSAEGRRYVEANREKIAETKKRYYEENRETISEYHRRRYNGKNRESLLEYQKHYYAENRTAKTEYQKQYAAGNREAVAATKKRCALAKPERYRESGRRGMQRRRAKIKATQVVDFTQELLNQRMAYYGNRCYLKLDCCTGDFEHVEHVKPIAKDGPHMLANLRPACKPCNLHKSDKWPFKVTS